MKSRIDSRHPRVRLARGARLVASVAILVASMVVVVAPAAGGPALTGPRAVEVGTDHALVSVCSFDGQGTPCSPQVEEATNFSAFARSVNEFDDPNEGRSASANASQNTTVDTSDPLATSVSTVGIVGASWTDGEAGDTAAPSAQSTSEFSVTFEVTDEATSFALSGAISAEGDGVSVACTTVTVTSPTGGTFEVATPSDCGAPAGQSILETGKLQPGTYSFSVVADAQARNADALGGTSAASFDVSLSLGCSIIGTSGDDALSGTSDDDLICGLGGNDTLDGGAGDDTIFGGGGNDLISGGAGNDTIFGEGGDEAPESLPGVPGGLFGGPGNDGIDGGAGVNRIEGGTGNDFLVGGEDIDFIFGDDAQGCDGALSDAGLDDDLIGGGGEQDFLFGCQGLDKISGGAGDDVIDGNTGNDVLGGNAGSDKVHGNDGSDKLTGGTRKDVLAGDGGDDTILADDGVLDVVRGGPGGGDEAKIDENIDTVTGVEVFLA